MRLRTFSAFITFGVLLSAASCPQAPASATLSAAANRSQTDVELVIEGKSYSPGQSTTVTIRNVPGRSDDVIRTRTPDATGRFEVRESFSLKHVPAGTDLIAVQVIARDGAGWSLIREVSASKFVIFF